MKPWTVPLQIAVAVCLLVINTAGYPVCIHGSAPDPSTDFGWPNTFLYSDLSTEQWAQVHTDKTCACGKPIDPRELPWHQLEIAKISKAAIGWNIVWAVGILVYLAVVCEILQRKICQPPFTIRGGLFLMAVIACFILLSRSGEVYLFYVQHYLFWQWIKRAILIIAFSILVYLIARKASQLSPEA